MASSCIVLYSIITGILHLVQEERKAGSVVLQPSDHKTNITLTSNGSLMQLFLFSNYVFWKIKQVDVSLQNYTGRIRIHTVHHSLFIA